MTKPLDLSRPAKASDWEPAIGDSPAGFAYVYQDGWVFVWSDSNIQYESLYKALPPHDAVDFE